MLPGARHRGLVGRSEPPIVHRVDWVECGDTERRSEAVFVEEPAQPGWELAVDAPEQIHVMRMGLGRRGGQQLRHRSLVGEYRPQRTCQDAGELLPGRGASVPLGLGRALVGNGQFHVPQVEGELVFPRVAEGGVHHRNHAPRSEGLQRPSVFDRHVRVGYTSTLRTKGDIGEVRQEHSRPIDLVVDGIGDFRRARNPERVPVDGDIAVGRLNLSVGLQGLDRVSQASLDHRSPDCIGRVGLPGEEDGVRHSGRHLIAGHAVDLYHRSDKAASAAAWRSPRRETASTASPPSRATKAAILRPTRRTATICCARITAEIHVAAAETDGSYHPRWRSGRGALARAGVRFRADTMSRRIDG